MRNVLSFDFANWNDLAKIWIGAHRLQFYLGLTIAGCLILIFIISYFLISTRPKPDMDELTKLEKPHPSG